MGRLIGKIALITGGARGIGEATAELFVQEGATTLITDINDEAGFQLAQKLGNSAHYRHLNVASEEQWQETLNFIENNFGQLNILVNNAAILGANEGLGALDPENTSLETWRAIQANNLDGVFLGCKYAIKMMKHFKDCAIVNISSRVGIVGIPHNAPYAASKAGVRNLTKSVALYCAKQGYDIRCNSIHPGAILTPLWNAWLGEGEQRDYLINEVSKTIPMQKMGNGMDVARAILFLACEDSRYVTGTELIVDGGILSGSTADVQ